uniref:DUF500 and SH3 domain protein n=1 Tax=Nostoc flagelliforme str. Sunitezuoqi TaxID=676037 RepID=E7DPT0_9NOSO|nr:DUF500 and SH3 domain protein [Nostoc flagelliforme str. Sunitezuoqi]
MEWEHDHAQSRISHTLYSGSFKENPSEQLPIRNSQFAVNTRMALRKGETFAWRGVGGVGGVGGKRIYAFFSTRSYAAGFTLPTLPTLPTPKSFINNGFAVILVPFVNTPCLQAGV